MIQIKEFSLFSNNNESLANKWLQENNDKYDIMSVISHLDNTRGNLCYVITYRTK
jgi:hypothetical protein